MIIYSLIFTVRRGSCGMVMFSQVSVQTRVDGGGGVYPEGIFLCQTREISHGTLGQKIHLSNYWRTIPSLAQLESLGVVYYKRQRQLCDNTAISLATLFLLKTLESLENGLQIPSGAIPLFSCVITALSLTLGVKRP